MRPISALLAALAAGLAAAASPPPPSALALVAADPDSGEVGVAGLSSVPAGVAEAGWARPRTGAAAVLGRADPAVALRALDTVSQGVPAPRVLEALAAEGAAHEQGQVALVDAAAAAAAQSGTGAAPWSGHLAGKTYACIGSGLSGEQTILAMGVAFETTRGDLADRLLAALEAGRQAEAGHRSLRSAMLRVARAPEADAAAPAPPAIDLRVDDHQEPVGELRRLLGVLDATVLHRLGSRVIMQTRGEDVRRMQRMLADLGFYAGEASGVFDDASAAAVRAFRREVRLEDAPIVDAPALEALRSRHREWRRRQPAAPTPAPRGPVESEILPETFQPAEPPAPSPAPESPPPPPGRRAPGEGDGGPRRR